ncbi:MAG: hypothetical protein V4510_13470 [bacterium]
MQATTPVFVCNLALSRLGQKEAISSIDVPSTVTERLCALHYDTTRRELLRSLIPNFARKRAVLTAATGVTPAFGFTTAYALPNDFIRLMALGDIDVISGDTPANLFDFDDGYLVCDSGDAVGGGVNVQYVKNVTDVTKFDALFVKAFRLQLAMDMTYGFTLKESLLEAIAKELHEARLACGAISGQEKPPRRIQRSRVRDVRRAGGIFRNNTRI